MYQHADLEVSLTKQENLKVMSYFLYTRAAQAARSNPRCRCKGSFMLSFKVSHPKAFAPVCYCLLTEICFLVFTNGNSNYFGCNVLLVQPLSKSDGEYLH